MTPLIPYFDVPKIPIPNPFNGGTFELHGFGFLVAIGFIVGGKVAQWRADRKGDDSEAINRLIGWLVVGTFVGGHVGYGLMYEPDVYLKNPVEFLKVWHGLSSFGGFIVCVPLAIWFFMREKLSVWRYLDHLAHGMAIGWFFGRMGCFVAHDHPGTVTNFYLGVYGICRGNEGDTSMACHDMGLYEALWSLAMFGVLIALDRLAKLKDGIQVLIFGLAYGPVRLAMDSFRPESSDPRYGMLTPAQWGSVTLMLVCAGLLLYRVFAKSAEPAKTGS